MINVALLGAGRMGQIHRANLMSMPHVHLSAIFDPADSALSVKSAQCIFDDKSIAACIIATPSTQHAELIMAAARAGKHIFCEKPVSFSLDVLREVKRVVDENRVKLQIGFNRRFDPSYHSLQQDVVTGKIGNVQTLRIINRDPQRPRLDFVKDSGGLFFDFNVHDFDMLRYVTHDEVLEVFAVGAALIDPALRDYDDIDTAIITATLKSGALAIIDSSRETGYGYDQQLEVFGSMGKLLVDNQSPTSVSLRTNAGLIYEPIFHSFPERYRESYRLELAHFFSSLITDTVSPNIDDAIAAVRIAQAAQTSLRENTPVAVLE